MSNFIIAITLLLIFGLTACSDEENIENPNGFQEISYGTSFGECLGYCWKSTTITPSQIVFTKKGWDIEEMLPDSTFYLSITAKEWESLTGLINLDEFMSLDTVIGCPDCADGGAEWVEIVFDETKYKVTFEYFNAPEVMDPYIHSLRNYQGSFD
jgi:hypothetical protein